MNAIEGRGSGGRENKRGLAWKYGNDIEISKG